MDPQIWVPGGAGLVTAITLTLRTLPARKKEPHGGRPLGIFFVLRYMGDSKDEARKFVKNVIAKRNGIQGSTPQPRTVRPIKAVPSPPPQPDDESRASPSS
jgi:hypothetical protein